MKNFVALFVLFIIYSCKPVSESLDYSEVPVMSPIPFAEGIISTKGNNEFDIALSPKGKTIYFTRRTGDEPQKIMVSNYVDGEWTNPEITSFSTSRDETPFVSPNGKTIYFGSDRTIPNRPSSGSFDMNIWKTEFDGTGYSVPVPVDSIINKVQVKGEGWPSSVENFIFTLDEKDFIYCTRMRGTKPIEIFQTTYANGSYSKLEKIEGLFEDASIWKYSAILSPDGKYLLFNSYDAPGGPGGDDIFVSKKIDGNWSAAKALGPLINTKGEEGSARFSPDGKYFFFAKEVRPDPNVEGDWNIFFVETKALELDQLF